MKYILANYARLVTLGQREERHTTMMHLDQVMIPYGSKKSFILGQKPCTIRAWARDLHGTTKPGGLTPLGRYPRTTNYVFPPLINYKTKIHLLSPVCICPIFPHP